mgnify:FL=1
MAAAPAATNQTQSGIRRQILQFKATPTHNPPSNQPNTLRFPHGIPAFYGHSGPPKIHQASTSIGPSFQLKSRKPLRPTTQRPPSQNTIRLPHGILALYGHYASPKKKQAARSTGPILSIELFETTSTHNSTRNQPNTNKLPHGIFPFCCHPGAKIEMPQDSQSNAFSHSDTQPNEKPTKHNQASAWQYYTLWPVSYTHLRAHET